MNTKKIILLGTALSSLNLCGEVEVPAWYNQVDQLKDRINTVSVDMDAQKAYFLEWDVKLQPWCDKLAEQNKRRTELFNCVRASFAAKDAIIQNLNTTLAEKEVAILDLQNEISTLEAIVAGLNKDLVNLGTKLKALQDAYRTLLELDEAKAQELLTQILVAKGKFSAMSDQRDLFRTTLQSFYQCAKSYSHLEKTEIAGLSTELGCNEA